MKKSELLLKIKNDIGQYESKLKYEDNIDKNTDSMNYIMSEYNRDNFNEIMELSVVKLDDDISKEELNDFKKRIDYFFSLDASKDEEFKQFIMSISLYLTFIAKKPLHPPGFVFPNGSRVYKNENIYYCTGKNKFIKDSLSLCDYCICKEINTK